MLGINICTVYRYLANYSGSSVDEICCATGMKQTAVRKALKEMIGAGYVRIEPEIRYIRVDTHRTTTYCEREILTYHAVTFKETE